MDIKIVNIPCDQIIDWKTFHDVFQRCLGFPDFYGANMNAWIDCLSYLDEDTGMTNVCVGTNGIVVLNLENSGSFKDRCPEQYEELLDCTAFVNFRRIEAGKSPILALTLCR